MDNNDIFAFLSIDGEQSLVGSSADKNILYSADYDLFEKKRFAKKEDVFNHIFKLFREKFKEALENPNIWITDFKCGTFRGQPLRWNKQEIKRGYKNIDDFKILFTDCLQQQSRIKLDIIAIDKDHNITEYSDIYMIRIGKLNLTPEDSGEEIKKSILGNFYDYANKKKYFKALKRLYSYAKLSNMKNIEKDLISIFNSSLGVDYKIMSDLGTLVGLLEQKFKPIDKSIIIKHLDKMKINTNKKNLKSSLNSIIDKMNNDINEKLIPLIKSNKKLYIYFGSNF
jgi:hypothetical protein